MVRHHESRIIQSPKQDRGRQSHVKQKDMMKLTATPLSLSFIKKCISRELVDTNEWMDILLIDWHWINEHLLSQARYIPQLRETIPLLCLLCRDAWGQERQQVASGCPACNGRCGQPDCRAPTPNCRASLWVAIHSMGDRAFPESHNKSKILVDFLDFNGRWRRN